MNIIYRKPDWLSAWSRVPFHSLLSFTGLLRPLLLVCASAEPPFLSHLDSLRPTSSPVSVLALWLGCCESFLSVCHIRVYLIAFWRRCHGNRWGNPAVMSGKSSFSPTTEAAQCCFPNRIIKIQSLILLKSNVSTEWHPSHRFCQHLTRQSLSSRCLLEQQTLTG